MASEKCHWADYPHLFARTGASAGSRVSVFDWGLVARAMSRVGRVKSAARKVQGVRPV